VMKLIEVIPGLGTSQETTDDLIAFSESLRKIPVRVQECAGFLVNRLLLPYLNEAAYALGEGAATAKAIDEVMLAYGLPMGPFTLLDMIGIDVSEKVAHILHDAYGPRMKPAPLLEKLVKAKRFGTKSGAGIYNYVNPKDDTVDRLIQETQNEAGKKPPTFSPDRLFLPMINEAAICLQEGVASVADIDIAMLAGTGFPQEKGGPLHYADQMGIDLVLNELEKYRKSFGLRFWPAPMLKRMVAAGYLGVKTKRGFFPY